ncbi:MAG: penicillin-binding protein 2 [Acidobacteria bacterium]|nr:penicillin-binding protein 2 [Acidobacteriota bacterium]
MLTPAGFEDRRMSETRLQAWGVGAILVFCALAVSFWVLQVAQHDKYEEIAANNHLKTIPLRAPRGVLFDRQGRVLVENRSSFTIAIVRERTRNLDETIRKVADVTGVPDARIRQAVQRRRSEQAFRPLPVVEHATFAQVAAVAARRRELPEVEVQQVPTRTYPEGFAAHLFGYVGEIQEAQLASSEFASSGLQAGAIVGQAGVERIYNAELMGVDGSRFVRVNSVGREIADLKTEYPTDGHRLQLTIDYDVQKAVEDAFRMSGYAGAAAILDPRTGELLAMTSQPSFDPNLFAVGIDGQAWSRLINDPLKPITNRLIQGTYSPGSTFKIVMSVAALETGAIPPDFTVYCPGHFEFGGRSFKCSLPNGRGHGLMDLSHAIEKSCNVFFYTVGSRMKIDTIHDYAARLGLVGKTGIDLPGEQESFVASTAWSERARKQPWYPGETISVSIGQGAVNVTPVGLATMIATIANGGTLVTPHLVKAVERDGAWSPMPTPAPKSNLQIQPDHLQRIRNGLWMVVNEAGTGSGARIAGRDVAGKTGTAQVISNEGRAAARGRTDKDLRDNAWFVFFAPRDNPQIAGAIFVEHGGHGGTTATPIARHVLETFFAKRDGLPLPPVKPALVPNPTPVQPIPVLPPPAPAQPAPAPGEVAAVETPVPAGTRAALSDGTPQANRP